MWVGGVDTVKDSPLSERHFQGAGWYNELSVRAS